MEQIHIVAKVARQYEGEYVFMNVLRAFKNKEDLREFVRTTSFNRAENINGVDCVCEIAVIEDIELT